MEKRCKNCGKKEQGYLSIINENGLCPFCQTEENFRNMQQMDKLIIENMELKYKLNKIKRLIIDLENLTKE